MGPHDPTDREIAERVRSVATLLDGLGHQVEEIADESICDWPALWSAYWVNWVSCRAQFATTAKERGLPPERLQDYLGPMPYRHYLAAGRYDKFDIWRMMVSNNTVTREFGRPMDGFDALLVPTMAIRVPAADGLYSLLREEELDPWLNRLCYACRYTMPANETGLPGISVPAGSTVMGCRPASSSTGNSAARTCCSSSPRRSNERVPNGSARSRRCR